MPRTRADLAERALRTLQLIGAGQSADAEDVARADDYITGLVADLSQRRVYEIPNPNAIDDAAFDYLAMLLGQRIAPEFGAPIDGSRIAYAEQQLHRLAALPLTGEPVTTDHF